jgi:hypothetical protein
MTTKKLAVVIAATLFAAIALAGCDKTIHEACAPLPTAAPTAA